MRGFLQQLPVHSQKQWHAVKEVCEKLTQNGFKALLAGGCVRDMIMNRVPNDFDIATSATPDQVEALFPKSLGVGKAFGVMILPYDGFQLEVATFRTDGSYADGRRPDHITFSTPEEDAKRRDFTVNALFYDLAKDEVLDFVGGEADIQRRRIRTVGSAEERFTEDKLRVLRALRFSAQLGFEIESDTLAAVRKLAAELKVVSRERIRDELVKLLLSPDPQKGVKLLLETGVLHEILPQIKVGPERLAALGAVEKNHDLLVRLALLLADLGKNSSSEFSEVLKNLKFSNNELSDLQWLFKSYAVLKEPEKIRLAEVLFVLNHRLSPVLLQLIDLEERASLQVSPSVNVSTARQSRLKILAEIASKYMGAKLEACPGKLESPWLTGSDLKNLGVAPGPKMGELLQEAYRLQVEKKLVSREQAMEWVGSHKP